MAEYMIIKDNIVKAIYCGKADNSENAIKLPVNHQVQVGDNVAFYNEDYTRKSYLELITLGLIDIPVGFKLENNTLIEMTYVEKVIAGLEAIPSNMKIENGQLLHKNQDEIFNEMTPEEKENFIRSKRDNLINEADILLIKYQEQVELGVVEQDDTYRLALLEYKECLRNVPAQAGFPANVEWPEIPARK